jgi:hypothetical protein
MSRKKKARLVREEGWALHNAVIRIEPDIPPPTMFFTNECTGERHPVGTAEPAPLQRVHGADRRSWAEKTPLEILDDLREWARKVRDGEIHSLAGPWDFLDYRPL